MNEEIRALRKYKEDNKLTYAVLARQLDVNISSCVRWLYHGRYPSRVMRKLISAFLRTKKEVKNELTKKESLPRQ